MIRRSKEDSLLALLDGKSWIMKTAKLDESLRDAHCAALRLQQSGNMSRLHVEPQIDVDRLFEGGEVQPLKGLQHVDGLSCSVGGPRVEPGNVHVIHRRPPCEAVGLLAVRVTLQGRGSGGSCRVLTSTSGSSVCCSSFCFRDVQGLIGFNSRVCILIGMPKEKYDPPDPRRCYTIMPAEEVANGKKSYWAELEISGRVRSLSPSLWTLTHLTALHINDNNLSRIPPDISNLSHLVFLNLSSNKLRSLPAELGNMGIAFEQQSFTRNPLSQDILNLYQESDGTRKLLNYMLDNLAAAFTVMCYNVLCDKYATRQLYGYCPSWALNWEYRKKGIMEEITSCDADIISLQEVETEQYYTMFLETLKERGYDGYFCPKSRAKLVSEQERKHVDGCAVFYKTEKFTLLQKHTVEFNQVAMANSEGSEVMLNRVMTKDNIGVAVLLEVNKDMFSDGEAADPGGQRPHALGPEYSDVKLIQTMMFLSELKSIAERASSSMATGSPASDPSSIPIVLCADLNSLPDSGVVEFLSNGGVADNHKDFKELRYNECLTNFNCNGKNGNSDGSITHSFQLKSAYDSNLMPYTNYTYDFKGVIDYIFFSKTHMSVLGLMGPLDSQWLVDNSITGCPHPTSPRTTSPCWPSWSCTPPCPTRSPPQRAAPAGPQVVQPERASPSEHCPLPLLYRLLLMLKL
ncbi:hypothetical protein F7725_013228 [Dissostichus mawsoni]|uniref:poly(A)-specific ribonuclease n=2 Tax=Nototheniidae TaxID=8206 RepID=A0A7J5YPM8_DISMA|nr:hypothetical protein F7725_013228 [Dissostichus mawsoni]